MIIKTIFVQTCGCDVGHCSGINQHHTLLHSKGIAQGHSVHTHTRNNMQRGTLHSLKLNPYCKGEFYKTRTLKKVLQKGACVCSAGQSPMHPRLFGAWAPCQNTLYNHAFRHMCLVISHDCSVVPVRTGLCKWISYTHRQTGTHTILAISHTDVILQVCTQHSRCTRCSLHMDLVHTHTHTHTHTQHTHTDIQKHTPSTLAE
jgi:hypothetical protein